MATNLTKITEHLSADELEALVHQMLGEVWALEPAQRPETVWV